MRIRVLVVGAVVMIASLPGCTRVKEATLERGVDLFLANNLEEAVKILEASVALMPGDPGPHAWYAECLRRLGRHDDAADQAYKALRLDSGHAFAHTVLADVFNPQYSTWPRADADSTWFHLREAVKNDPADGNAWSSLWVFSMRRGEQHMERRAAEKMIDSGFLTKPLLEYNRWQMSYLPENAIVLTNGDMDTYPAVALQHKEGLRPDVLVVNLSLLNLGWYARMLADRHSIPMPVEPGELESLHAYRDEEGGLVTPAMQIVQGWVEMQPGGGLGQPLCAAVTVADPEGISGECERMVFCGPYFEITASTVESKTDLDRLAKSLEGLSPADFEGPFVSAGDRSPVRRAATDRIATNVTAAMLRYAIALAGSGRWTEAAEELAMAEAFDARILAGGQFDAEMDSLRLRIEENLPG
jgi:tetratricopeptide (TPR) repeat protein